MATAVTIYRLPMVISKCRKFSNCILIAMLQTKMLVPLFSLWPNWPGTPPVCCSWRRSYFRHMRFACSLFGRCKVAGTSPDAGSTYWGKNLQFAVMTASLDYNHFPSFNCVCIKNWLMHVYKVSKVLKLLTLSFIFPDKSFCPCRSLETRITLLSYNNTPIL